MRERYQIIFYERRKEITGLSLNLKKKLFGTQIPPLERDTHRLIQCNFHFSTTEQPSEWLRNANGVIFSKCRIQIRTTENRDSKSISI